MLSTTITLLLTPQLACTGDVRPEHDRSRHMDTAIAPGHDRAADTAADTGSAALDAGRARPRLDDAAPRPGDATTEQRARRGKGTRTDVIYGILSAGGAGITSQAPANLFTFEADNATGATSSFTDVGTITLSSTSIDVDGLAHDGRTLYGFYLSNSGADSTLIEIDTATAAATTVGSSFEAGIRGAAFVDGDLWALDSSSQELLQIDTATGKILDTVSLSYTTPYPTMVDLSFDDGSLHIVVGDQLSSIDMNTGALTTVATLPELSLCRSGAHRERVLLHQRGPKRRLHLHAGSDLHHRLCRVRPQLRTGVPQRWAR